MFFIQVLKILFWVFSLFGLFVALRLLCGYYILKQGKFLKAQMVLFVENDEETIEGTIRVMAEEIFFTAREKVLTTLTVVDMGCSDSSMDIAKILMREYPFLRTVSKEEYICELNEKLRAND